MTNEAFALKEKLMREGGIHLGTARSFLQWHVRGGDTVTWGSQETLPITVAQIEEMAAEIAAIVLTEKKPPYQMLS